MHSVYCHVGTEVEITDFFTALSTVGPADS